MARWSQFNEAIWNDADFLALGTDARLLFIWSWTNPDAAICGLYPTSVRRMALAIDSGSEQRDRQLDALRVTQALDELARKPMVRYDYDNEVLFVLQRAKHANRSPKTAIAMRREYERCPASPLKSMFARRYPAIAKGE
jgi:hypothetical protein